MKNYYTILGVARDASLEEIKKAYRNLVRKYHPDMGDHADVERFLEVQEAFEVLRDRQKREAYDEKIELSRQSSRLVEERWRDIFSDLELLLHQFHEYAEGPPFGEGQGEAPPAYVEEGLTVDIIVTPDEAQKGGRIRLDVPVTIECPHCEGSGVIFPYVCFYCNGRGIIHQTRSVFIQIPRLSRAEQVYDLDLRQYGIRGKIRVVFKISYY